MIKIILWMGLILCPYFLLAQKVGDSLDHSVIQAIIRSAKPALFQEEERKKIIIIDFWGSKCETCIANMPKMLELQEKFKKEILIVYATQQDSLDVQYFFSRRTDIAKYTLPMITNAQDLVENFPHTGIPHVVWIGNDQTIKAITSAKEVNEENISELIKSSNLQIPTKNDILEFNVHRSLLRNNQIEENSIMKSSMLLKEIPGLGGGISRNTIADNKTKILATNVSLPLLYSSFYRDRLTILPYEIQFRILGSAEAEKFLSLKEKYCFETITATESIDDVANHYTMAIKELDQHLSLKSSIRKIKLECYLLKFMATQANDKDTSYVENKMDEIFFFNKPISTVANFIASYYKPDRLIRISKGSNKNVTIRLSKNNKDFNVLKEELLKQGIALNGGKTLTEIIYLDK